MKKLIKKNLRLASIVFALIVLTTALSACGGGGTDNDSTSETTPPDIQQPEPSTPEVTVADIMANIDQSIYLDATHINAGFDCSICHTELPEDATPPEPTTETCLSCHGGTYDALAETTAHLGENNPHNSHEGQLGCTFCHNVHEPFYNYCALCHSYDVDVRFN
ncbi:cytochrome c3 family protein [Desulfuribacillus alkaliarsenatis]|uniref:Tetrahaem cytochrome domain-containing protein n=1 Tax=Desulfuribacillus alkaliarsenatis TaxID=766136 RepID=A0A1E5G4I1_9FIRM|nr:cytochrome c3 family protein [Desulfuribacillus alkaliarsenatis]OEF98007.1 hypothetical protein BHF68_13165 [Desulfuribacillus alkaliarsenatis]